MYLTYGTELACLTTIVLLEKIPNSQVSIIAGGGKSQLHLENSEM